ncbi:MAG: hypothetical protein Phog2KO_11100 [Phototrophicaceae bacterium]
MMPKQDHRAREKTLNLILQIIEKHPSGLTRTQIATAIERTKTPHLIKLIESLVDDGYVQRQVKIFGNGVEGYLYIAKKQR